MNSITNMVSTIRQAPWRTQRQWIGLFLLGLVLIAMVASIYLTVSVRSTLAGREAIALQNSIITNEQLNSDLEANLAALTSFQTMQSRAYMMGFEYASLEDITYLKVPGYAAPAGVDLSLPESDQPIVPVILPAYTESWFDFLLAETASLNPGGQK